MLLAMTSDVVLPTCDLKRMCAARLARLRTEMANQDVDAAILLHGPNVTYATGFVADAIDASHMTYQRGGRDSYSRPCAFTCAQPNSGS